MKTLQITAATVLALLAATGATPASAQQSGIGRHEALRHDLDTPGHEAVQVHVSFAPGASFPMHTHPGVEIAYVLEGTLAYSYEDRPPVVLEAGQSLYIPAGTPHAAHNPGASAASELATYLVEKGKPIVALRPAAD
jgi:quercetin dioxygenase-like cupin family protein